MNHLNLFNPYKNKENNHEDELTRNFLILVKNIPIVQVMFFEMIKKEMDEYNIDSISLGELNINEIYTQIANTNNIFYSEALEGRRLVSVIISNDKMDFSVKIKNINRSAIYDGVVISDPSWIFIIENKPLRENIWPEQLSPNISGKFDIEIIEKPCCLSWRVIISALNNIIQNNLAIGIELTLIEDFIEYIDNEFSWINPYTKFGICKNNKYLLNKRCVSAMSSLKVDNANAEVKYHNGWKHYFDSGKTTIRQIAVDTNMRDSNWSIDLWMYAGNTMNSAREIYLKIDTNKLFKLSKLGFEIESDFHIAYRSSNLLNFKGKVSIEDYIDYWGNRYKELKQIKREEFATYFESLVEDDVINNEDNDVINEKILLKKYDKLNICPGILIKYSWSNNKAVKLDQNDKFVKDLKEKINMVYDVFGEHI